ETRSLSTVEAVREALEPWVERVPKLGAIERVAFPPLPKAFEVEAFRLGDAFEGEARSKLSQLHRIGPDGREPIGREKRRNEPVSRGDESCAPRAPPILLVAREELIAAVARENDFDLSARALAQELERKRRGIGERLIEDPRKLRHALSDVPR